jgi:hypothetical protein
MGPGSGTPSPRSPSKCIRRLLAFSSRYPVLNKSEYFLAAWSQANHDAATTEVTTIGDDESCKNSSAIAQALRLTVLLHFLGPDIVFEMLAHGSIPLVVLSWPKESVVLDRSYRPGNAVINDGALVTDQLL